MSTATVTSPYRNAEQVIHDRLPYLKIGMADEIAYNSGLSNVVYEADLSSWKTFEQEVHEFRKEQALQDAFDSCDSIPCDNNLATTRVTSPHFARLEHTMIAEERDLHGRFLDNVTSCVKSAVSTLLNPKLVPQAQVDALKRVPLTRSMTIGSAKLVPPEIRGRKEPDLVVRIPRSGIKKRARLVGELKFSETCNLEFRLENLDDKTRGSLRHKLGQVARDMRACGVRFGFLSTYKQTIFLKIVKEGKRYGMVRSKCYHDKDAVRCDKGSGTLSGVSTRLGLLYLLSRASHSKHETWKLQKGGIPEAAWTTEHTSDELGNPMSPYNTPYNAKKKGFAEVHETASVSGSDTGSAAGPQTPSKELTHDMAKVSLSVPAQGQPGRIKIKPTVTGTLLSSMSRQRRPSGSNPQADVSSVHRAGPVTRSKTAKEAAAQKT